MAWQDGAFLRLDLQQQLILLQDLDGLALAPQIRSMALQLAWDNGVFLKREPELQRGVLSYLVKRELDKRQELPKVPVTKTNTAPSPRDK